MASKKSISTNDELSIDVSQLLKKWWYFRKLIFFGTGIVVLSSLFIIIMLNQTIKSNNYTSSILRGDLGDNNSLIIDTFNSVDIIDKVLKVLSLDVSANKFLDHLVIKKGTDPLTMSLKSHINSLDDRDIKRLSLNIDDLNSIVKNLDNTSSDKITVELYHSSLNLNNKQAINIINKLVNDVNRNLQKHTSMMNNNLNKIDTNLFDLDRDKTELIIIFNDVLNSIEDNIVELQNYKSVLIDVDLVKIRTLTNISKRILVETSKLVGSTYSSEVLNLELLTVERNIKDLKNSLLDLDSSTAFNPDNYNDLNSEQKTTDNFALDGDIFNTILSIGGTLQLNEFRLETLRKIQEQQLAQNLLLSQKELLKVPFEYERADLSVKNISKRILGITTEVNGAIDQIYKFIQPKKTVHFLRNPEIIEVKKFTSLYIKNATILSLISFFLISFIAILLPQKSFKH
jgi:ferritin-like protein